VWAVVKDQPAPVVITIFLFSTAALIGIVAFAIWVWNKAALRWLLLPKRRKSVVTLIGAGLFLTIGIWLFIGWAFLYATQPAGLLTQEDKSDIVGRIDGLQQLVGSNAAETTKLTKVLLARQRLAILQPVLEMKRYDPARHDLERLVKHQDQSLNIALDMDFLPWSSAYDDFQLRRKRILENAGFLPEEKMTPEKLKFELIARQQHVEAVVQILKGHSHFPDPSDG
jgi:hypothetical protein